MPKPSTIKSKYSENPAMANIFLLSTMNAAMMKSRNTLTSERLILLFLIFREREYPANNINRKIISLKTKPLSLHSKNIKQIIMQQRHSLLLDFSLSFQ